MKLPANAFPGAPVRADDLQFIIDVIRQGHCCAVVGPSNTGKSYLLKSLVTTEGRRLSAPADGPVPVMVFVDCLEAGDSEQAFYELLLRRTIEELAEANVSASTVEALRALHQEVLNSIVDVAIRSIYASSVRQLGHEPEINLVLILDEFDDVFRTLPPWPFRQLRALCDALGPKLCFVTGTSYYLEHLREGADTYEFRELFHLYTRVLKPLSAADAGRFVAYLTGRQDKTLTKAETGLMIELSGGHPGLLERIYTVLSDVELDMAEPRPRLIARLSQLRPIQKECRRLWSELDYEHEALLTLATRGEEALSATETRLLIRKGLVVQAPGRPMSMFSPLFRSFVETKLLEQAESRPHGLRCDFETGQIWLDDTEMTLKLSEQQRKLVTFLCQNGGAICSYDEIAEGVWGVGEGVSPGAIYELVKRVRQKIEPDWKNPSYIVTVPGKGYRLEQEI